MTRVERGQLDVHGVGPQGARAQFLWTVVKDAVDRREEFRAARPEWPWAQILPPPDGAAEVRGEWVRLRDSAVVCNLASLAVAPRPEDYDVLEELVAQLGGMAVAKIQHDRTFPLEPDPDLPIGTAFTLALTPAVYRSLSASADEDLAELCACASMRFLLQGMDDVEPAPPIETVEEFLHCFETASLLEWRRQLMHYALEPWSPYTRELVELAEQAGHQDYLDGMRLFLDALREETNQGERQTIAAEVRRLVDDSGLSRREFARRVGTSASRLSSYAVGGTTPSAAMFLRIRRAASQLRAEAASRTSGTPAPPSRRQTG